MVPASAKLHRCDRYLLDDGRRLSDRLLSGTRSVSRDSGGSQRDAAFGRIWACAQLASRRGRDWQFLIGLQQGDVDSPRPQPDARHLADGLRIVDRGSPVARHGILGLLAARFRPPLVWPALGLAAFMAWVQAIAWLPLAKGLLRELVILAILLAVAALPIGLFVTVEDSRNLIGTLLAGYILAAFAVGYRAVASNRCGAVWPLWPSLHRTAGRATRGKSVHARRPFTSPSHAQLWYEWNCHGWIYPAYMGMVYFLIMGLLVWRGALAGLFLFGWVLSLLMSLPVIMAGATGPTLGAPGRSGSKTAARSRSWRRGRCQAAAWWYPSFRWLS